MQETQDQTMDTLQAAQQTKNVIQKENIPDQAAAKETAPLTAILNFED